MPLVAQVLIVIACLAVLFLVGLTLKRTRRLNSLDAVAVIGACLSLYLALTP